MTNYEHLIEGGINAFVEFFYTFDPAHICERNASGEISTCEYCDLKDFPNVPANCSKQHFIGWLESEREEQDSFDKLLADLDKAGNVADWTVATGVYFTAANRGGLFTAQRAYADIAERIRDILEGER